jgi:hypothetical protein
MEAKMIITVTSIPARQSFELPADTPAAEIRKQVRRRFGMQVVGENWMLPHNYCGRIDPPPVLPTPTSEELNQMFGFRPRPGHLRVV